MLTILLLACKSDQGLQERAENAALVCYDNGTLVYTSETTVDELDMLLQEWRSCNEAKEKRLAEYRKVRIEHCSRETYRKEQTEKRSFPAAAERAGRRAEMENEIECMRSKGYADPFSDSQCIRPEPYSGSGGNWRFVDKGVLFHGFGLKCVPRIPVVTTNKEKK